jgi:hypothetical protein
MTIFDLLFLAVVLASAITLITAAVTALFGGRARAVRILRRFGICAIGYIGIVAVVGLLAPRWVIEAGEPWCFDDWCLSVAGVSQTPAPPLVAYHVSLRIFSQARRVSQRALGAWIYVVDQHGNRYAPDPDPSAVSLEVMLGPGESVSTSRTFRVPAGAGELGLVTGHGPCCITTFIIADPSSLFHKRTYVRLTRP